MFYIFAIDLAYKWVIITQLVWKAEKIS